MSREYKAFISYRHTPLDMKVAKAVHTLVEQYRIPKGLQKDGKNRLGLVFRDQEELPVSSNLSDDICNALDHAEFLIVICTPNTPKSIWVQREIEYFLSKHPREKVLAVLAEGEPVDAFPERLRYAIDPETGERKDVEPLACDVRGKNDREVLANIKKESPRLFAAMLGCPYDTLVMREQKRKRKRLLITASVILAIVLAFTALAVANNIKLNKKNAELEEQRLEILKRESEMLTVNAEDALENGDYLTATRHAVNALPHGENADRPYIAGAEGALIEALDVFDARNEEFWMVDTTLSQESRVVAYNASPDGARLVTVDLYGTANMFDTKSGECLYTIETNHSFDINSRPLFTNNIFILHSRMGVSAYDMASGQNIWTFDETFTTLAKGVLMTEDGSALVFVKEAADPDGGFQRSCLSIVKLNCKDGKIISEAVLIEDAAYLSTHIPDGTYGGGMTAWGDLNADGNKLAGTYIDHDEEYKYSCNYYVADLEKGTVEIVYTGEKGSAFDAPHTPIALDYNAEDGIIKAVCNSNEENVAVTFIAIDVATGQLKWESSSAIPEGEEYISYGSERRAFFTNKYMMVSAGCYMMLFDAETGEYLTQGKCDKEVVSLSPMEHEYFFFNYVTAEGKYTFGWYNGSSFSRSDYGNLKDELGSAAVICNGSFVPTMEDSTVKGQTAGNEEQGLGYVAVVPLENDRTVKVFRAVPLNTDNKKTIELTDASYFDDNFFEYGENLVAIGPVTGEDSSKRYDVINTETHEVIGSIPHYKASLEEDMFFMDDDICYLPDYKGFVACDELGDIILYDENGLSFLVEKESIELEIINDVQYITSRCKNSSVVLTDSKNVITASLDTEEKTLTLWENGKETGSVSLKDAGVNSYMQTRGSRSSIVCAGKNGYVILSHYAEDAEEDTVSDFAVYDINSGSFGFIKDSANGSSQRKIFTSDTKPSFAVVDTDGYIRVYDIFTEKLLCSLDLPVPYDSVSYVEYKDEYIVIKTGDDQLFIYTDKGESVYRDGVDFIGDFDVFTDKINKRLYVKGSSHAICFETNTWQIIAEIKGFIGYIPNANEVYFDSMYSDGIEVRTLPSTYELIRMAQEFDD